VDVIMAADDAFAKPLAVGLRSLSDRAGPTEYRVFVLHSGFDDELRQRVEASCDSNLTITWLRVPAAAVDGVQVPSHLTRASAYRIVAPMLLPADVTRVLYLDSDVLVRQPLDDLWRTDLGDAPAAAVRDAYFPVACLDVPWRPFGIAPDTPYFNTGVLVIELDRWRALDVPSRAIALLRELQLYAADQTALNMLFANRWYALSPKWNLLTHHLAGDRSRAWAFEDPAELDRAIADPAIVHFNGYGFGRPWEAACAHPYRDAWIETLDRTAWSGWRPRRRRAVGAARRVGRAGAALLGRAATDP